MEALLILFMFALAAGAGAFFWARHVKQRRTELKRRFGREYDKAVEEYGGARVAEGRLARRQKRMAEFDIRPLTSTEYERFSEMWAKIQKGFVDNPIEAVGFADGLVAQLMETRGYPMDDFEHRVEDLSVDHGNVVQHYRAARALAGQVARGQASTEDLRQAMIHYRVLFADLLVQGPRPSFPALSEVRP